MTLLRSAARRTPASQPVGSDAETGGAVPTRAARRPLDRAAVALVVLGVVFGSVFALVTPPMWGPDETSHYLRAYVLSEGYIAPRPIPDPRGPDFGGEVPDAVQELGNFVAQQLADQPDPPAPRVTGDARARGLAGLPIAGPTELSGFPSSSTYSPVPYVASVAALAVARAADTSIATSILLMRFANLMLYLGLAALALLVLRRFRVKWVLFVAALLPMALFQGSMISTDGTTNGAALVVAALVIKSVFLRIPLRRAELGLLALAGITVPLAKNAYLALLLLLLLVAVAGARRPGDRGRVAPLVLVGGFAAGLAAYAWWAVVALPTGEAQKILRSGDGVGVVEPRDQIGFLLAHPAEVAQVLGRTFVFRENMYFSQFFGDLGWAFVPIPAVAWVAVIAAAVLAAATAERFRSPRAATVLVATVVVLGVATVFGALYLGYSPVGYYLVDGVQGRYFIPFAVLAAAVVMQTVPLRFDTSVLSSPRRVPAAIVVLTTLALGLGAAKYSYVLWH